MADPTLVEDLRRGVADLEDTDDHFLGRPDVAAVFVCGYFLNVTQRPSCRDDEVAVAAALRAVREAGLDLDADAHAALWAMRAVGLLGEVPGLDEELVTWRRGVEADLAADATASGEAPARLELPEWSLWGPEPPTPDTERELELLLDHGGAFEFIRNRLDNVAAMVVQWMPREDNQLHHNAVEHLLRVRQEIDRIEHLMREVTGRG